MAKTITKEMLTSAQKKVAEANLETINFWIANPVTAVNDLFNIVLLDYQSYMFQMAWIAEEVAFVLSRNAGKTILSALYVALRQMLIPSTEYWILGKDGKQSKKLFSYIERLALDDIPSFKNISSIYYDEIEKPNAMGNGFSHNPSGYRCKTANNSQVITLNDNVDGNRGQRGTILVDEASFVKEDAIIAIEPYATQNADFQTSMDEDFDQRLVKKQMPLQKIYFSSAGEEVSYFFSRYREIAKKMIAGDSRYFACSIDVDVPLNPTIKGKKSQPLLKKSVVDSAMATNKQKALREYYNHWDKDGGDAQIISSIMIDRASTLLLPEIIPSNAPNVKYGLFFDSASRADNSVCFIAKFINDEKRGWYMQGVNLVNFKDLNADKKKNLQESFRKQLTRLRELLVRYNGNGAEYENIERVLIDGGAGGGGHLYGSELSFDFTTDDGETHRGIIDKEYYESQVRDFPNAYDILNVIEPTKWKNIMIEETIEMMNLGLIELPKEYNGSGYIDIEEEVLVGKDEEKIETRRIKLTKEQELALTNLDLMKQECKLIHKYVNPDTKRVTYKVRMDFKDKAFDDRFYVFVMAGHVLATLRRDESYNRNKKKKSKRKVFGLIN